MTNTELPAPAARDFTAEFIAARVAVRNSGLVRDANLIKAANAILRAAKRAGVALDEIALDEIARQEIVAARPVVTPAPAARPFWL